MVKIASLLLLPAVLFAAAGPDRLWYRAPASNWNEALPLGNGRLGAMVFGGVSEEHLSLNEDTLWSGGPREWNNPDAREILPLVRKAVIEGRYGDADVLSKRMQGPYTESYMPMGDLFVDSPGLSAAPSGYRRELDLERAIATTVFRVGAIEYRRAVFASHPDRALVLRFTATRPHSQNLRLRLTSQLHYRIAAEGSELVLRGKCPRHVEPAYLWQIKDAQAIQYAGDERGEGMAFQVRLRALAEGGQTRVSQGTLEIQGADAVTLIVTAATSYNGWDKSPGLEGRDPEPLARDSMRTAASKSYPQLVAAHLADYQQLFGRVSLNLGPSPETPTDERLRAGIGSDPALAALVFDYARYLLICTSRPGGQPGNLKGMWNARLRPEYSSNWCIDHDAQMYYYPVEVANLSETHEPFLDFIEGIAINGRRTAQVNYGMEGWVSHHNADLWRQSAPVGGWGAGNPHWASFALSGPWLAQHFWEHYEFGGDTVFLRDRAWPLMKGAAEFCLDWLMEDSQGRLVTNPSVSPENIFVLPDGTTGQISQAATVDMSLIWDLFAHCIEASRILGVDPEFAARLRSARERLLPPKIGSRGQLQEWSQDWESTDPGHRHLSHMFGIFPGNQWTPFANPSLTEAAKQSLRIRDAGEYGWSLAWKAACWARLREGNEAFARLQKQILYVDGAVRKPGPGWMYPNLFNADPPDVILNGTLCSAAAIAEMLLQSHAGEVDLLPALPSAWPQGEVKGLRARGGYQIDMKWTAGRLASATIRAGRSGPCRLRSAQPVALFSEQDLIPVREVAPGVVEFDTKAGKAYRVTPK